MNDLSIVIEDICYLIKNNQIEQALLLLKTVKVVLEAQEASSSAKSTDEYSKIHYMNINASSDSDIDSIMDEVRTQLENIFVSDINPNDISEESIADSVDELFKRSGLGE
jgi:hypothetical protein